MTLFSEAGSVGIIGGADGPTAIFVSGSPLWLIAAAAAAVLVLALLVTCIVLYSKRK